MESAEPLVFGTHQWLAGSSCLTPLLCNIKAFSANFQVSNIWPVKLACGYTKRKPTPLKGRIYVYMHREKIYVYIKNHHLSKGKSPTLPQQYLITKFYKKIGCHNFLPPPEVATNMAYMSLIKPGFLGSVIGWFLHWKWDQSSVSWQRFWWFKYFHDMKKGCQVIKTKWGFATEWN